MCDPWPHSETVQSFQREPTNLGTMIGKDLPGVAYQYATLPSFNDFRTLNSSIKSTTNGVRLLGYINTHHVINNKTVQFSLATSNICESGLFLPEIATARTITGNNSMIKLFLF